jgi:hypothetical protein
MPHTYLVAVLHKEDNRSPSSEDRSPSMEPLLSFDSEELLLKMIGRGEEEGSLKRAKPVL